MKNSREKELKAQDLDMLSLQRINNSERFEQAWKDKKKDWRNQYREPW